MWISVSIVFGYWRFHPFMILGSSQILGFISASSNKVDGDIRVELMVVVPEGNTEPCNVSAFGSVR